MKFNKWILGLIGGFAVLIMGCGTGAPFLTATPNPAYVTTNPQTGATVTNAAVSPVLYSPSPGWQNLSNTIAGTIAPLVAAGLGAIPQTAIAAPAVTPVTNYLLGGAFAIMSLIAAWRNQAANNHAAAAAALGAAVNGQGAAAIQSAINISAQNGSTSLVSSHINNAQKSV